MSETPKEVESVPASRGSGLRLLTGVAVGVFVLFCILGVAAVILDSGASAAWPGGRWIVFGMLVGSGLAIGAILLGIGALLRVLTGVQDALNNVHVPPPSADGAPGQPAEQPTIIWPAAVSRTEPGTAQPAEEVFEETPSLNAGGDTSVMSGMDTVFAPSRSDTSEPVETGQAPAPWQDLVQLLEDIRDNSLLSPEERKAKRLRVVEEEISDAHSLLHGLIKSGDFAHARLVAERAHRKYPEDERTTAFLEQVERAREQQESEDVEQCTRQVEDLISVSAWKRARDLAHQLQDGHPDSVEARQLMLRVEREYAIFQEEQRRRMYAEVQRYVTKRRWEDALVAARTFIERFPGCEDAEAVRLELPTLETNAEIETRQRLEAKIMDFARHGRYLEAVDLARKVITRYPDSPQAEALRKQLGRLEAMANNAGASSHRMRENP